jgi:hypothetical protein
MMRLACSLVLSTSLAISGFAESPQATQEIKNKQSPQKTEVASLKQPLAFGLEDGTPIKLRLTRNLSSAGGHTGAMTGAMIGTAIVFFPAAPLFLFMHGKDITIPKGTEVTAYINGDIPLDPLRFQPKEVKPAVAATAAQPPAGPVNGTDSIVSLVEVKSTPDGADITVDDKYMGSTPSTLKLAPGDHKIKLEKSGFKAWERTLAVSAGGNANVNATLEKE